MYFYTTCSLKDGQNQSNNEYNFKMPSNMVRHIGYRRARVRCPPSTLTRRYCTDCLHDKSFIFLAAVRSEAAGHSEQGPSDPCLGCCRRLQSAADSRRALFIHNSRPLCRWATWDSADSWQHNLFIILAFISALNAAACLNNRCWLHVSSGGALFVKAKLCLVSDSVSRL